MQPNATQYWQKGWIVLDTGEFKLTKPFPFQDFSWGIHLEAKNSLYSMRIPIDNHKDRVNRCFFIKWRINHSYTVYMQFYVTKNYSKASYASK
jgi:hypothetical protein